METIKKAILLFNVIVLLSSCKKEKITVNEVEGSWIEIAAPTNPTTFLIKLTFNTDGSGTTTYGTGAFRYSLADGTLNYNLRADPTWKISVSEDDSSLTLTSKPIIEHFTRVP